MNTHFRFLFTVVIIWLSATAKNCLAQPEIKLNDITKFSLNTEGGGLSGSVRKLEVVKQNNIWKCYQTKLVDWKHNDSTRTFIKNIPEDKLNLLLKIIAVEDTSLHISSFNINTAELIKAIDSLKSGPKNEAITMHPAQRAEFIKALQNDSIVKTAFEKEIKPLFLDDRTYYSITITTNNNTEFTIHVLSFAEPYYLPWYINNKKNYNPNITILYEFISGNDESIAWERERLNLRICTQIYRNQFLTPFNWDDFKNEQPALFRLLNKNITPIYLRKSAEGFVGRFKSEKLPAYAKFHAFIKKDDELSVNQINRYQDTLIKLFKKPNFLFKYLEGKPNTNITFGDINMGVFGADYFKVIRKFYVGIDQFDYKETHMIQVFDGKKFFSRWLLLPDNTLLLLSYRGTCEDIDWVKRLAIDSLTLTKQLATATREVGVLFNSTGKVLHNYGNVASVN
ncbi:hypothetical protein GCM10023149_44600 [Mucilaginibacter gynuensis]|uniref:Uncharacterized protein n=1 Tax=Mucilaginibacter gynuensis TaxID=1302236 RepID=A0ABP8H9P4_9SPHI